MQAEEGIELKLVSREGGHSERSKATARDELQGHHVSIEVVRIPRAMHRREARGEEVRPLAADAPSQETAAKRRWHAQLEQPELQQRLRALLDSAASHRARGLLLHRECEQRRRLLLCRRRRRLSLEPHRLAGLVVLEQKAPLELSVLDVPTPINVKGVEDGIHVCTRRVVPERHHRHRKLLLRHLTIAVAIPVAEESYDAHAVLLEQLVELLLHAHPRTRLERHIRREHPTALARLMGEGTQMTYSDALIYCHQSSHTGGALRRCRAHLNTLFRTVRRAKRRLATPGFIAPLSIPPFSNLAR